MPHFFHLSDNRAADDDFASRVAFAGFGRGFLFERVEALGEGFPLLFDRAMRSSTFFAMHTPPKKIIQVIRTFAFSTCESTKAS